MGNYPNYGTHRHNQTHVDTFRNVRWHNKAHMSSNIRVQRICQHCGNAFTARTTVTKYCDNVCSKRAYKENEKALKIKQSNKETEQIKSLSIEGLKVKMYLNINEACKLVGISRRTIYRLIKRGDLNIGKAGKRTIIKRSDLEQALFNNLNN